jgi:hypothetical protein
LAPPLVPRAKVPLNCRVTPEAPPVVKFNDVDEVAPEITFQASPVEPITPASSALAEGLTEPLKSTSIVPMVKAEYADSASANDSMVRREPATALIRISRPKEGSSLIKAGLPFSGKLFFNQLQKFNSMRGNSGHARQ